MVEVRYRDRLGNQMFQYALGRIIAEHLGFALVAAPLAPFPATHDPVSGQQHEQPTQHLQGNLIDLPAILADPCPRRILLDGWFQRPEYFLPHRDRLRRWFHPVLAAAGSASPSLRADLVVHVRRTDYLRHGWALPFSFYESAIQQFLPSGGKLCLVTDDPSDPFFRRFQQWHPEFFHGDALATMAFLAQAPRLILSPSTFSWWPAFLGKAETIICPVPPSGPWAPESPEAITLAETPGFIPWPVDQPYVPDLTEHLHQRKRYATSFLLSRLNHRFGTQFEFIPY